MKTLTLYRRYFPHGTYGILYDDAGNELSKTVERPLKNNQANISCVLEGIYQLVITNSPRFGRCYALVAPELGVTINGPSLRTHILFHTANLPEQLQGCIAPGLTFGVLNSQWAVLKSKPALKQIEHYLAGQSARLIIRSA